MRFCPICAVEIEDRLSHCPLCNCESQREKPEVLGEYPEDLPQGEVELPKGVVRLWVLLGVIAFGVVAMMVCTIVDITQGDGLSWSPFVFSSIATGIILLAGFLFLIRHPIWLLAGVAVVVGIYCVVIDALMPPISWSLKLALPIVALFILNYESWLYLAARLKPTKTIWIVSFILTSGIFCLLLEWLIGLRSAKNFEGGWALPVFVSLSAVAVGILVVVSLLKRNEHWKRYFDV